MQNFVIVMPYGKLPLVAVTSKGKLLSEASFLWNCHGSPICLHSQANKTVSAKSEWPYIQSKNETCVCIFFSFPLVQIFYQNINIYVIIQKSKHTHTHKTNNYIILSVLVSHTFSKYSVQLQGKVTVPERQSLYTDKCYVMTCLEQSGLGMPLQCTVIIVNAP